MKIVDSYTTGIQGPSSTTAVGPIDRGSKATAGRAGDGVSLSADARWVNAVKDEMRREPEIRSDLVRQTKDALAAGTYERGVDLDTLVTNFLADL
jgi:anti-sigma28 factor (negative regulator of flagellin synthesis)